MKSASIIRAIQDALSRAWATLGLPLSHDLIQETKEGIVDPEALLVATALFCDEPRVLLDVAVWAWAFEGILIHQKLTSIVRRLPSARRQDINNALKDAELAGLPEKVRRALGAEGPGRAYAEHRLGKLVPAEVVAQRSQMLLNRYLLGASARADIVTTLQLPERPRTGAALAQLLAVNPSTVSRILEDLRICKRLDRKGRFVGDKSNAPGFYISTRSVMHLQDVIDASKVNDPGLRKAMLPNIEEATDGLAWSLSLQVR